MLETGCLLRWLHGDVHCFGRDILYNIVLFLLVCTDGFILKLHVNWAVTLNSNPKLNISTSAVYMQT